MAKIKYGLLHCHTDNSFRDSTMSVERLVSRAKELGAPAVALTDHGNMTGYIEFVSECKKAGIKPIVGVETYVEEMSEGRRHLILMAKDYTGFQSLIKAVTESNRRVEKVGPNMYPRMDKQILKRYFGPGAKGHGHVIATSACVNGVLAGILLSNEGIDAKIEKLKAKQAGYMSPDSDAVIKNKEKLELLTARQKELNAQIKGYNEALKKSETLDDLKQKCGAAPEGSKSRAKYEQKIAEIIEKSAKAKEELPELQKEKEKTDRDTAMMKGYVKKNREEVAKWQKLQNDIDKISEPKIPEGDLNRELRKEAEWYRDNFGEGCFYIELQYHGIDKEKEVMPRLCELSDELDIPVCIANDAHTATNSADDILARNLIRTTMFNKWENIKASDKEMYIKTDEELIKKLCEILPENKVMEGYCNTGTIVDACNIEFPEGDHYPAFDAPEGYTPETYLKKMAYDGIEKRYPGELFTEEIKERLDYELDTIITMGYASYLCIVEDFLRYARAVGKLNLDDPEEKELALTFDTARIQKKTEGRAGESVGPGRGSAAGSIVCYLIGITNIDPIKYRLLFERFLNPERVSMPDIDCDISGTVRPYVILYVKHKYGEDSVCGIMTKMKLMGKAAIRTAGRIHGLETGNDSTKYDELVDGIVAKTVELYGSDINISLRQIEKGLKETYKKNKTALTIIRYALLIEGVCTQIGQHAAGVIITDGHPVDDYVPLIYGEANDMMLTQCDMVQAEETGLLKMDFLGLNNLTMITETLQDIQKSTGEYIDMDNLPEEKEVFDEIFSKGMTNSVFQFESDGMKQMLKSFRPESIEDLILLVAMYRPGPLQFLQNVIDIKNGKKGATYLTPKLEPILKDTYSSITYQEQVQEVFKQLAGYSLGQADVVRRAMAKKKEKALKAERKAFVFGDAERNIAGCLANGITEETADALFDELTEFSSYAFNKSHAACYAVVAYQTAWLKYHYPAYYMKAVLNNTPFEKYAGLFDDLAEMDIDILQPDVNKSRTDFVLENGDIRYGLGKIKGLGDSVRYVESDLLENGPYRNMDDFIIRELPDKKILTALVNTGAFDCFYDNRKALNDITPEYLSQIKKIKNAKSKILVEPDEKKAERQRENIRKAEEEIRNIRPDSGVCENGLERLKTEKELLGAFVSRDPLTLYPEPHKCGAKPIAEVAKTSYGTVMGIISDCSGIRLSKKQNKYCKFKLKDKTEQIEVTCFNDKCDSYGFLFEDDAVITVTGKVEMNSYGGKQSLVIYVDKAGEVSPKKDTVILTVKDIDDWMVNDEKIVKTYVSQNGNPLLVYDLFNDEYRQCKVRVTPEILNDKRLRTKLIPM